MTSIGIDLGTTYSCIAIMQKGKVEIIPNEQGNRITPSCVAFTETERLIGEPAKLQMTRNVKNTVYDVKRFIGRKFRESVVQADLKNWSFNVIEENERPKISIQYKKRPMELNPEEISSMILAKMKKIAEDYTGEKVQSAVITVPAYFNDSQRRATQDAAIITDLKVLKMINEPTAAALAYGFHREKKSRRNVLIYDLGGGTFDVSIVAIVGGCLDVQATGGNAHLGGQDFNERLYTHFLSEFTRKTQLDMSKDERAKQRLREQCEAAKKMLSSMQRTRVQIDSLFKGKDFDVNITRARFEDLNEDLFSGTMDTVGQVMEDAKLGTKEIDEIVLVGGSTRIPYIQELLRKRFGETRICKTINPDEAVAYGAAVQAAMISGNVCEELKSLKLQDVTPLSLGLENRGTIMNIVIKRNTKIPVKKWNRRVTLRDNQTKMTLKVFEGERSETKLNHMLGSFTLSNLPAMPARQAKVNVCFEIDASGVLNVTARDDNQPENEKTVKISWDKGRWSKDDITRMVKDAEKFREDDKRRANALTALSNLEIQAKKSQTLAKDTSRASNSERMKLLELSQNIISWIDDNPDAEFAHIGVKMNNLEKALLPFK